ncbi:MAG: PEP-CTERM sorting domain-containing protein [Acidobacteria bacterium]|nr:PEP-CTERM sorting domain-containing protein [Acidobacteriota bacterium]
MNKKLLSLCAVALLAAPLALANRITFSPVAQTVLDPAMPSVDVVYNPEATVLGSYDIFLTWDASLLDLLTIGFGTGLGELVTPTTIQFTTPGVGMAEVGEVSLLSPADLIASQPAGPFTLFTLTFKTKGVAGTSPLVILPTSIFGDENGMETLPALDTGAITVRVPTGVPEPSTIALLGAGLAAGALLHRRRRN